MPTRLLILTASYGEGHNAAARALAEACVAQHGPGSARVVDLFALAAPRFNAFSRRAYLDVINRAPRLWSRVYAWIDRTDVMPFAQKFLGRERRLLSAIIAAESPDAICSTYPLYAFLLARLVHDGRKLPPHYNVVTDSISINSLWWRAGSAGWFLPNEDSAEVLRRAGLDDALLHVTGFPVPAFFGDHAHLLSPPDLVDSHVECHVMRDTHPNPSELPCVSAESPTPAEPCIKAVLPSRAVAPATCHVIRDTPPDLRRSPLPSAEAPALSAPRILYIINSGTHHAEETARRLLAETAWEITIAVGRDESLRRKLTPLAAGRARPAHILGWTDQIPHLLMTHHVVISKAGGATTQEAIAARCPMILNQVVPGQEEGNYELLRRHHAGALAETPDAVLATLHEAFANHAAGWRRWREALATLTRNDAARDIVSRILTETKCGRGTPLVPRSISEGGTPLPLRRHHPGNCLATGDTFPSPLPAECHVIRDTSPIATLAKISPIGAPAGLGGPGEDSPPRFPISDPRPAECHVIRDTSPIAAVSKTPNAEVPAVPLEPVPVSMRAASDSTPPPSVRAGPSFA